MCGMGSMENKSFVFFPDLQTDLRLDATLRKRYGLCVSSCPKQGTVVSDYAGQGGVPMRRPEQPHWFVSLPSFAFAGRCIPYEPRPESHGVEFCAAPPCEVIPHRFIPTRARQVCGTDRDNPSTENFWLLSKPDADLIELWRLQDGVTQNVINARIDIAKHTANKSFEREKCEVIVKRHYTIVMKPADDEFLINFVTKYTGLVFRWCSALYKGRHVVLGLGIGGSLLTTFVVICVLTCCARHVVITLLGCLFIVLGFADYILFQQAGVVTGNTGRLIISAFENHTNVDVPDTFEDMLREGAEDEHIATICRWSAIFVALLIPLLACLIDTYWTDFEKFIALLQQSSQVLREMPSLLVFPVLVVLWMVATSVAHLFILQGVATMEVEDLEPMLPYWVGWFWKVTDSFAQAQIALLWMTVFSFLWAYFMHVAMFVAVVSMGIQHWYFHRHDPSRNSGTGIHSGHWFFGKPALIAFIKVCRYHLGTMAFGSFVLTVATIPRIVLEFIVRQTKADKNRVGRLVVCVTRCLFICLQNCLQFLTEYAYIYTAVTGKPFCSSAHASFILMAKYPRQVALNAGMSTAIGYLVCITVPVGISVVAYYLLQPEEWAPCTVFIFCLAYVTTRLTVSVYDVCITTLFVCLMRDLELSEGKYAPDGLRKECDLLTHRPARTIELNRQQQGTPWDSFVYHSS